VIFAITRFDVADYVSAVFWIYSTILIVWIIAQILFSLGVSVPYSRVSNAVLDFLRDCSEPYLRIFRRLGLRAGPMDFSPIVALIVLRVVASIVVGVISPG
jgi:YggT family protein